MKKLIKEIEDLYDSYIAQRKHADLYDSTFNFYDGKAKAAEEILAMIKHKLF